MRKEISDALEARQTAALEVADQVPTLEELASDARDLVEAVVTAGLTYNGQRFRVGRVPGEVLFEGYPVVAPFTSVRRIGTVSTTDEAGVTSQKAGSLGPAELLVDVLEQTSDGAELAQLVVGLAGALQREPAELLVKLGLTDEVLKALGAKQ